MTTSENPVLHDVASGAALPGVRARTSLLAIASALVLVACGGGGSETNAVGSSGPLESMSQALASKQVLKGRVKALTGTSVKVCIDLDGNGVCNPADPSTTAVGDTFALTGYKPTDVSGALLAEYADAAGVRRLVLTAPALNNVWIDGLSTLASERMVTGAKSQQSAFDAAFASVVKEMSSLNFAAAVDPSSDARLLALDNLSIDVLLRAWAAGPGTAVPSQPLNLVLRAHARASVPAIAKYVDPLLGRLLPTVTSRTPASEVAGALYPVACPVEPASAIVVDTVGVAPILTKTTYVDVAKLEIRSWDAAIAPAIYLNAAKVRGRGNYTWTLEKKPYKLKFNAATPVLGMPADTEWAMLANHTDKSLLRNALAMCTGRQLELGWVPKARFAQLTLNGSFDGLYQVFEHVKAAPQRVDLGAPAASATDFAAGYLIEINFRLDETYNFVSGLGVPYSIKAGNTSDAGAHIQAEVEALEAALADPALATTRAYLAKLDVESLVDFYILQELGKNWDAFNSSSYVHRARGASKLGFGPPWDFDLIAGNGIAEPQGFWIDSTYPYNAARNGVYVSKLLADPAFRKHLVARWRYLSSKMPLLQAFLRDSASAMHTGPANPIDANFVRWPVLSTSIYPNVVALGTYDLEFAYLTNWLTTRASWLDAHWTTGF